MVINELQTDINKEATQSSDEAVSTPTEEIENVDKNDVQSICDADALSTPKSIVKPDESRAFTIPRYTKRSQQVSELASVTPKRTQRMFNVPEQTEKVIPVQTEEQYSEMADSSTLAVEEKHPESPEEQSETKDIEEVSAVFTTPAKVEIIAKSSSTITRSSRRQQQNIDIETMTSKRTQQKLNMSVNVPQTPCEAEVQSSSETIQNEDEQATIEEQSSKVDKQIETSIIEPEQKDLVSENIELAKEDALIEDEQVEEKMKVDDIEADVEVTQSNDNDTLLTPAKVTMKPDESRAFTLPRYTKRSQQISELATVTPKRTPRKFNVPEQSEEKSSEMNKQPECDTADVEEKQPELSSSNSESLEEQSEIKSTEEVSAVFATPAKVEMSVKCSSTNTRSSRRQEKSVDCGASPERTPRTLNVSMSEPEVPSSTISIQNESNVDISDVVSIMTSSDEQNETTLDQTSIVVSTEPTQSCDEAVEIVSTPKEEVENVDKNDVQNICDADALSTPAKSIVKPDESRAFTIPRYTKRSQQVSELASVTPKRTPLKFNVPEQTEKVIPEQTLEQSSEVADCSTLSVEEKQPELSSSNSKSPEEQSEIKATEEVSAVFATPVKVEMSVKCSSNITRSSRRQQQNIDVETMTPKRTQRKLNMSVSVPKTPCEPEVHSPIDTNQHEDVQTNDQISEDVSVTTSSDEQTEMVLDKTKSDPSTEPSDVVSDKSTEDDMAIVEEQIEEEMNVDQVEADLEATQSNGDAIECISMPTEEVVKDAESSDNQDKNTEYPQNIIDVDPLSTPAKAILLSDESRALTIPRYTKRSQKVSELASVTPKRTPRKFNVPKQTENAIPVQTEEQSSEVADSNTFVAENAIPEQSLEADKQLDCGTSNSESTQSQNEIKATEEVSAVFATPAKIEMNAKCCSTNTRLSKRQQKSSDVKVMTPKRTPRKLNMSVSVTQTPGEVQSSTDTNQHEDVQAN
ncbi:histone-lysine N-methyltransferase, H3 lysine-79 specific-like, partial [Contarinia nasturtii]|uniref:histone-lysine N-methyltransferase, H3 lysine-79 specific-like n=1 Tax=Contarinia nasturtii TaxID=265458 RepID=UPI0012D3D4AB